MGKETSTHPQIGASNDRGVFQFENFTMILPFSREALAIVSSVYEHSMPTHAGHVVVRVGIVKIIQAHHVPRLRFRPRSVLVLLFRYGVPVLCFLQRPL